MYEGFEQQKASDADVQGLLDNMKYMLQPNVLTTPDFSNLPSPTYTAPPPTMSRGSITPPVGSTVAKSQPATPNPEVVKSSALEQGAAFDAKKAKSTIPDEEKKRTEKSVVSTPAERKERNVTQHRCPVCAPPIVCPPAPICPNMRDYIKKDSIPCWGCKLK